MRITIDEIQQMVSECVQTILSENVYMDKNKVNTKKKSIGLTYRKGLKNKNTLKNGSTPDYLNTDKMDKNNAESW